MGGAGVMDRKWEGGAAHLLLGRWDAVARRHVPRVAATPDRQAPRAAAFPGLHAPPGAVLPNRRVPRVAEVLGRLVRQTGEEGAEKAQSPGTRRHTADRSAHSH